MSAVTVHAEPGLAVELAPVIASLPDDFVFASSADVGEVAVVDGCRDDWPSRVQEALGKAHGVLLREPGHPAAGGGRAAPEVAAVIMDLAGRVNGAGVPVVVDRRWSGAPGISAFAEAFAEAVTAATSVTVLLVEAEAARTLDDSALDALGLLRATGAPVGRLDTFHRRAGSWSAWGTTSGGAVLHLQGVHTAAGRGAVLTASSATIEASIRVPDASSAAPALARRTATSGEQLLPTEFESAARAAWRRLRERMLTGDGAAAGNELAVLADDLATLGGAV